MSSTRKPVLKGKFFAKAGSASVRSVSGHTLQSLKEPPCSTCLFPHGLSPVKVERRLLSWSRTVGPIPHCIPSWPGEWIKAINASCFSVSLLLNKDKYNSKAEKTHGFIRVSVFCHAKSSLFCILIFYFIFKKSWLLTVSLPTYPDSEWYF